MPTLPCAFVPDALIAEARTAAFSATHQQDLVSCCSVTDLFASRRCTTVAGYKPDRKTPLNQTHDACAYTECVSKDDSGLTTD